MHCHYGTYPTIGDQIPLCEAVSNFALDMDFKSLYRPFWPGLAEFVNDHRAMRLSPPLLLACPREYAAQPLQLFIVGQQTRTWYNNEVLPLTTDERSIDILQGIYSNSFQLGAGLNTPFWQFVRRLCEFF
jgi:hypothetical protein